MTICNKLQNSARNYNSGILIILFYIVMVELSSCSNSFDNKDRLSFQPTTIPANGYIVPSDSLLEVHRTLALDPIPSNVNINNDPDFENQKSHVLRNIIPGKVIVPVVNLSIKEKINNSKIQVGKGVLTIYNMPDAVLAKDPYRKDINPQNFISYSNLQGLRHDQVRCIIQDKIGNIWLGTDDGLTKYDGKYFTHFTTIQGLASNNIRALIQDRNDNIWIGTFRGGITKFDGTSFTTYTKTDGFPDDIVNCIFEDYNGNIWFGTSKGAVKYDGKSFLIYSTSDGLASNEIRSIIQDNEGKMWFGSAGSGISVFNGKTFANYSMKEGLADNFVGVLFKDRSGNIWIGTSRKGAIKFDGTYFTEYSSENGLISNSIRTISEDLEGNIWFGTINKGIIKFDGKCFTDFNDRDGLISNFIWCSFVDSSGDIWFGTNGGGLTRFDGRHFTILSTDKGIFKNRVFSILEENRDNIWLGTSGGGVFQYSKKTVDGVSQWYLNHFGKKEGLMSDFIFNIIKDKSGRIWFATDGGGVSVLDKNKIKTYTKKEGLSSNSVRKIFQDKEGNLWFGTVDSGVIKFDGKYFTNYSEKSGLSGRIVYTIFQDNKSNIWFGTNRGLTLFDGKNFIQYTKKQGFFSNPVFAIIQDQKGLMWFGTSEDGIISYDGKNFKRYSGKEGLNLSSVFSIAQDSLQNIWLGTRSGLEVVKYSELENNKNPLFRKFTYDDGFPGIGCNPGALTIGSDGKIWIGTTDRLITYHTTKSITNDQKPSTQLTNLQLFNESIPWGNLLIKPDSILILPNGVKVNNLSFSNVSKWNNIPENLNLPYNQNFLTFNYIYPVPSRNKKIKYQYMLEGFDKNWTEQTDRTEAYYGNISHGKYKFRVKAIDPEGNISNEIIFPFTVSPPWWQTKWFYSLILITMVILIYSYIINREARLIKEKEILQKKIQEQTRELIEKNEELEYQKKEILDTNKAIEKKNEELQILNNEKDKFFSIIAHDLRSPFSGFLGLSKVMAEELPSLTMSEIQKIASSMMNSASNISRLLENLLQWSSIKQGLTPYKPEVLSIKTVIDECVSMSFETARNKNIIIESEVDSNLKVFADNFQIQTIIRNLLSNAIKFTKNGGNIKLSVKELPHRMTEISVKDDGIGINEEMLSQLFRLDVKTYRKGTNNEPSTGIGLLLCKEFVEKHGGKIWAKSIESEGSEFLFTVPSA